MTNKKRKIRKGQFGLQTPEQMFQSNSAFNGSGIGSVTGAANPGLTYNFANDPAIIEQLNKNYAEFDKLAIDNSVVQMSNPNGGTSLVKADLNKFLNSALTRDIISPTSPSSAVNNKLTKDLTGSLTSVIGNSSPYQAAIKAADKAKGITGLFGKAGGLSKANNTLNKEIIKGSGISTGAVANGVLSVADSFIPKAEDKASKVTSGILNGASSVFSIVPGFGTAASVALKALGSLLGAGVKSVKGNTANELVDISSSYTGEDALAAKKFGLLGLRGAKKYAGLVAQRQINRDLAADVLQEGKDDLLAANNVQQQQMRDILSKNGDDWMYMTRAGKFGMKIKEAKRLSSLYDKKLQQGGNVKKRSILELIDYAKQVNPRFIQRLSEPARGINFIDDEGQPTIGSHYLESTDNIVYPRIQEINGKLKFLNSEDAYNTALKTGNYLKFNSEEEAIDFGKGYKQGWPEFFKDYDEKTVIEYKNGGSINVIPEGALHARKNNLTEINPELEGITKKGIPVISKEEGGEMIQHAEIECNELILRLEATKKIEELRNLYNSSENTKDKDSLAIEAGKLLTIEIMENTDDRTGLMKTI